MLATAKSLFSKMLSKDRGKGWYFAPPALLGGLILALTIVMGGTPQQEPLRERARLVRTIDAPLVDVVPRALGYGNVQPGTVWEAVAEVGGRITYIHPQLKKGAILPKGVVLLKIDPSDYQLAIEQIKANRRGIQAQLQEIDLREKNTKISQGIEERTLALGRKDLKRKQKLLKNKNVSQAAVDQEERNVLAQELNVQNLRNILALIPAERDLLKAQVALYQAQLEGARLDLARTTLIAPANVRISQVNVELAQYAAQGKVLAMADNIAVAEVVAQLPIGRLHALIQPDDRALSADTIMERLPGILGLTPIVRLKTEGLDIEWKGRLARISDTIDPATRTVGVIVAVDGPYTQARPGIRPPLTKNMFVEVELKGRPWKSQVVVPRSSLHGQKVYVVDHDNRLQIKHVEVLFAQSNFAVIRQGLGPGEKIIVSDLVPAIDGMLVEPIDDPDLEDRLIKQARGEGSVQ